MTCPKCNGTGEDWTNVSTTSGALNGEDCACRVTDDPIMWWFCACSEYPEDPGSVVCWRCEQPLVDVQDMSGMNGIMVQNLLGLCVRYRRALEEIVDSGGDRARGQLVLIARQALDQPDATASGQERES